MLTTELSDTENVKQQCTELEEISCKLKLSAGTIRKWKWSVWCWIPKPAVELELYFLICIQPPKCYPHQTACSRTTWQSDVSVDRRAAWGHETLDKGHACPLSGKSSMHSFPAIVLQPVAQISLVQVETFPSYSLSLCTALLLRFLFLLIQIYRLYFLTLPLHFRRFPASSFQT